MNSGIVFVSDVFLEDGLLGGAEYCNDNLINHLSTTFSINKIHCAKINLNFLQSHVENKFIITNFMTLSQEAKSFMAENLDYCIIEYDHKYTSTNNPSLFKDFLVPEDFIINKRFFQSAKVVFCQSKMHTDILQKNLLLKNLCNLGGNIWTDEQLDILEKNIHNEKDIEYGIIQTNNKNKGMSHAIDYCNQNSLKYELLPLQNFNSFAENLSRVKTLVFFPQWMDSYNRLVIEARMLNCKLLTNSLIGAASEDYFHLKGKELLSFIRGNNSNIYDKIKSFLHDKTPPVFAPIDIPKVSIIGTFYKSQKFMEGFLKNITEQTVFEHCELILINANSPENEEEIVLKYVEKYSNIVYKKLDYRASTSECFNMGVKISTGEYLTFGL